MRSYGLLVLALLAGLALAGPFTPGRPSKHSYAGQDVKYDPAWDPPKEPYHEYSASVQETEYSSFGSELSGSFGAAALGVILFLASFAVLFCTESYTFKQEGSLAEARAAVRTVPSQGEADKEAEGKLVHTSGQVTAEGELRDPVFTSVRSSRLRLKRQVSVYQWVQRSSSRQDKHLGGGKTTTTTYTYHKEWLPTLHDSSAFKNPPYPPNPSASALGLEGGGTALEQTWTVPVAYMGRFQLRRHHLEAASSSFAPLRVTTDVVEAVRQQYPGKRVHEYNGEVFVGEDPHVPRIGDVRIRWSEVPTGEFTILGQQSGSSFEPWVSSRYGGSVLSLAPGSRSAAAMLSSLQSGARVAAWVGRLVGFLLMWIGLSLSVSPLVALANVLPFLGSVLSAVTSTSAFLVAIPLTVATIAVAWLFYRPLWALALLVAAGGLYALVTRTGGSGDTCTQLAAAYGRCVAEQGPSMWWDGLICFSCPLAIAFITPAIRFSVLQ